MKFFDLIRTANHNLFRSKIRTLLTILAIFVGSFTIILNVAINSGANAFIDDQMNTVGGEDYLIITKGVNLHEAVDGQVLSQLGISNSGDVQEYQESANFEYMKSDDLEKIKKVEGIKPETVSERDTGVSIDYIRRDEKDSKRFVGIGGGTMPPGNIVMPLTVGEVAKVDSDEDIITIAPKYPQALGYEKDEDIIGKTIILGIKDISTKKFHEFPAKVVGVQASGVVAFGGHAMNEQLKNKLAEVNDRFATAAAREIIEAAQASFDLENYSEAQIKENLEKAGYSAMTTKDIVGEIRSFFDVILIVFSIFGGIALLAAAIGIINTLYMSVEERTREIGLDKALGMSSGRVFAEFATEAILLGFWGSIAGVGVAMLIGLSANQAVHAPGAFLEAFPTFELFRFTIDGILPIIIVVMLIAFVAGTLPALRAARKNPIDALRYE